MNAANRKAFLDTLAYAEGTSTSPATRNDGYDVIVTGADGKPEIMTNYRDHPFFMGRKAKLIRPGLRSTAAGRYQFLVIHWNHYRQALALPDFSPSSQDRWALKLIRECRALDDIDAGRIAEALHKCRSRWASLPGAGYGQPEHELSTLLKVFVKAGGTLAKPATAASQTAPSI